MIPSHLKAVFTSNIWREAEDEWVTELELKNQLLISQLKWSTGE